MDATRRMNLLNEKGATLVLVAVTLFVLIALAGFAIDMAYMHANKAQLQKAADSGALAGAGRLNVQPLANLSGSRNGAKKFTDTNFNLTLDTNSTNDPEGDIVLGRWNPTATTQFTPAPSGTPVNAVKVTARKTGVSGTGIGTNTQIDLFLSKIFGADKAGAAASAIAWRPPRARTYFMVGYDTCSTTSFPLVLSPANSNMAWTSLLDNSTNSSEVRDYFFCPATKIPFIEVCGHSVYTSGGTVSSVFKSVELDFYDLNYDAGQKTFGVDSHGVRFVATWKVVVPVSTYSDPTLGPSPQPVYGYAELVITRACGSGGGNPCPGRSASAPSGVCGGGENDIVISSISCLSCANSSSMFGALPVLAK